MTTKRALIAALFLPILIVGCATPPTTTPDSGPDFRHGLNGPPTPWSHENFDAANDKFTFAIITDLNGGEREGVFNVAVAQLAALRPELIMSIGDLIDGGTEDRVQLAKEWDSFDERAAKAPAPLFRVGGNHDLTNMAMRQFWAERYGPRYYHFVYKNVLFLAIDSEDYTPERMREIYLARDVAIKAQDGPNPPSRDELEYYQMPERRTGEVGPEQSAYFERVIAENPDVRWTFVFMHKPVWMREADNNLERIEAALADRPYTLFNGHFHDFSHRKRNGRDYTILATTGGGQPIDRENSFDQVTLVTVGAESEGGEPSIAHLRLDGILDKTGIIPAGGDKLCFQSSKCGVEE